jgi:hypothetical protein
VNVDVATGIDNNIFNNVSIYPNPAKDFIYLTNVEKARISVYDVTGAKLRNIRNADATAKIDVAGLAEGIYILKIELNQSVKVARFIKE